MTGYDGIVLAGGAARRLGGVAKPTLRVGGRRLLDVALAALAGAERLVVVGPPLPAERDVHFVLEEPAGGGPVAALAAALPEVGAELVAVLASDLPFVTGDAVEQLVAAVAGGQAALAVDRQGRDQPLLACYSAAALAAALPPDPAGRSLGWLVGELSRLGPVARVELAGEPSAWWDCDDAADLAAARRLVVAARSGKAGR